MGLAPQAPAVVRRSIRRTIIMMNDLLCGAGTVVTAVAATEGLQLN